MSLVPSRPEGPSGRTVQVSRDFYRTGRGASYALWVKVCPRHFLLKMALVPAVIVVMLIMLIIALLVLGFIFLAMTLAWVMWRLRRGEMGSR